MAVTTKLLRLDYFDSMTGEYIASHNPVSNSMTTKEMIAEVILKHAEKRLINLPQGRENVIVMVHALDIPMTNPFLLIPKEPRNEDQ